MRNLLQDFYATGGTEASGNTNAATNGRDMYDSHVYWCHTPDERGIQYLGNKGNPGTIGAGGYFPNADQIVMMGFSDENTSYNLLSNAAGGWGDRANTTNANIVADVGTTKTFISNMETAAGNNTIYRGIFFRVSDGGAESEALEE